MAIIDNSTGECIGCGCCMATCPCDAIRGTDYGYYIDESKCNDCDECEGICPVEIIYSGGGYGDPSNNNSAPVYFDETIFDQQLNYWDNAPFLWGGQTKDGIDCSHLIWQVENAMGNYCTYCQTDQFANNSHWIEVTQPQNYDIAVWSSGHAAFYYQGGLGNYWGATDHGVRWGSANWFGGTIKYYRYKP